MVSLFSDVDTSEERLEFSGSSSEDIACAKLFWQTVCLQPHLESGLVSSDVSQRRRSAPLPGCNATCIQSEPSQGIPEELLAKAAAARHCEQQQRLERLSQMRYEDRARLSNHRLRRERLEQKIHQGRIKKVLPPIQNAAAARETMALIEQFEREIVQTSQRPDTA